MGTSSFRELLFNEMCDIKKFHSISPQYIFYSQQYTNKLNNLLYRGIIDKDCYSFLINGLYKKKDTKVLHTFSGIEELVKRYRPRLGELDLLYNSNLSVVKVLGDLSEGIYNSIEWTPSYYPDLYSRINHIIQYITESDNTKDNEDRSCYYNLSIVSDALFISGKVHYNKYLEELTSIYKEIYTNVINKDRDFYTVFAESYLSVNVSTGFTKYSDDELMCVNVLNPTTFIHHEKLRKSNVFSDNSNYDYADFLIDKCNILCDLINRSSSGKSVEEVDKLVMSSDIPDGLKSTCSNDLYALRTSFIESLTNVINAYYWYNTVQEDFVYHCTPQDIGEGYEVARCICTMLSRDSLVEYALKQAMLISIANDRDVNSFNLALYECLYKLNEYGMMDSYKEVYEKFKQST